MSEAKATYDTGQEPMTRGEALELAMDAISNDMAQYLKDAQLVAGGNTSPYIMRRGARYARYAKALAYLENMARQKGLF